LARNLPEDPPIGAGDAVAPGRPEILRSVLRALDVLNELAAQPKGATPKAISAALGLHLSTTYHLLNTLLVGGYVVRCASSRTFQLGPRLPYLNNAYLEGIRPEPVLMPFVHALQKATGEMASLNRLRGNMVVSVVQIEGTRPTRITGGYPGYAAAAHATAAGRVLLAWMAPEWLEQYLARPDLDERSPSPLYGAAGLRAELDRIRATGYGLDGGSAPFQYICCVAAPIARPDGDVTDSLAVVISRSRYERDLQAVVAAVRAIALAAEETLANRRAIPDGRDANEAVMVDLDAFGVEAVRAAIDVAFPRIA
jgi:DNA-binding IclR family transcriptional regulator